MFKKSVLRLIPGSVIAAAIVCVAPSGAAQTGTNGHSVAGWVSKATPVGAAPDSKSVTIAVHMALRDSAGLKQLVAQVSSPSSKQYGQYLSTQDFAARFAPHSADVAAAKALLENAGMTHVKIGAHGAYVSAVATISQLRSTFHVTQNLYSYNGRILRANKEEPTLPASMAGKVVYVEGLDDSSTLRHPFHKTVASGESSARVAPKTSAVVDASTVADASADANESVAPPPVADSLPSPYCNTQFGAGALVAKLSTPADVYGAAIPWLDCGYTPQQIQAAYGLDKVKYDGKGITVAILDAYGSPTILADANRYAANHDLPKLKNGKNFSQIVPKGIYDVTDAESADCGGASGWWEEESLDVAAVHGSAPGATILYVGSEDCGTSLTIALFNTVYNHLADVVTNSYGYNGEGGVAPADVAAFDQAMMAGAVLGTTVLVSSGDDGDLSLTNLLASGSWEATSSYVTGVGGTSLFVKDAKGTKSEYGWGNYRDYLTDAKVKSATSVLTSGVETTTAFGYTFDDFAFYSGSGGGISLLEPQPAYQAGVVPEGLATTLNLVNGIPTFLDAPQRVSPDVAMVGDPYTGYLFGETFTIAGDPISDSGCKPISKTTEYCENSIGGTSLSSPLMAGVIAVMNQKRAATGEPLVGFANPLLYSYGSGKSYQVKSAGLNQVVAPAKPISVLRGYANDLTKVRVVTINSVPFQITTAPVPVVVCPYVICEGVDEIFNYTSLASADYYGSPTPAGYNDVTGLGVPYVPKLVNEE